MSDDGKPCDASCEDENILPFADEDHDPKQVTENSQGELDEDKDLIQRPTVSPELSRQLREIAHVAYGGGRGALTGEASQISALDADRQRAENDDLRTDTELKRLYATRFSWILIGQLAVMNGVFIGVGVGCLNFDEPLHLNLFLGGTLAEVFGIVFVITKYLFSKRPK